VACRNSSKAPRILGEPSGTLTTPTFPFPREITNEPFLDGPAKTRETTIIETQGAAIGGGGRADRRGGSLRLGVDALRRSPSLSRVRGRREGGRERRGGREGRRGGGGFWISRGAGRRRATCPSVPQSRQCPQPPKRGREARVDLGREQRA